MINTVTINVERYDELRKYEEAYEYKNPIVFDYSNYCKRVYVYSESDLMKDYENALLEKDKKIQKLMAELNDRSKKKKSWWQKLFK